MLTRSSRDLLLVTGVGALLLVVFVPVLTSPGPPRRAICASHLHEIGRALKMYVDDWGRLPPRPQVLSPNQSVLLRFLDGRYVAAGSWRCPAAGSTPVSYGYHGEALWETDGKGKQLSRFADLNSLLMLADADTPVLARSSQSATTGPPAYRHHGKALVLWMSGRTQAAQPAKLQATAWNGSPKVVHSNGKPKSQNALSGGTEL